MDKNKIIILMGISCSGKSSLIKEYMEENLLEISKGTTLVLSTDKLREKYSLDKTSKEVFPMIDNEIEEFLKTKGKTVLIDSTNLSIKRHQHLINLSNKITKNTGIGIDLEVWYKITHPSIWEKYANNRISNKWTSFTMEKMFDIRQSMFRGLGYPININVVKFFSDDIAINEDDISEFLVLYERHKEIFINDTENFITKIDNIGLLEMVLPEIKKMIGFNQQNANHTLTLDKHVFSVANNYEKTEIGIWTALLHDVGKTVNGIKQAKEDGGYSYIGHAGASTELAYLILKRLKFDEAFIVEVMKVISFHMVLPYTEISEKTLNRMKNRYGEKLFNRISNFRLADISAK